MKYVWLLVGPLVLAALGVTTVTAVGAVGASPTRSAPAAPSTSLATAWAFSGS